jgi:hypothetical protein
MTDRLYPFPLLSVTFVTVEPLVVIVEESDGSYQNTVDITDGVHPKTTVVPKYAFDALLLPVYNFWELLKII